MHDYTCATNGFNPDCANETGKIRELNIVKREIQVSAQEAGLTILDLLEKRFTYLSRAKWHDHILAERIFVNDQNTESSIILKKDDRVAFFPEPRPEPEVDINYEMLYEDENIFIINKPPDLPCHPGGIYLHNTLWGVLRKKYSEFYLINRLDRETSGIVMIAKNKKAASYYFWQMKEKQIVKEYEALVEGCFPLQLEARGWLMPDDKSSVYKKRRFSSDPGAYDEAKINSCDNQFACTYFSLLKELPGPISHILCRLETGRTHQIRASLYSLGFPVVGDKLYGIDETIFLRFPEKKTTQDDWFKLRMTHQALHCRRTVLSLLNGTSLEVRATRPRSWLTQVNY